MAEEKKEVEKVSEEVISKEENEVLESNEDKVDEVVEAPVASKDDVRVPPVVTNEDLNQSFIKPVEVKSKEETELKINEARKAFHAAYNKEITKNRITGFAFLAVMIAVVVIAWLLPSYVQYVLIGAIALFLGVLVLTKFARRNMDIAVGDYLQNYGLLSDSYVYDNADFEDIEMGFRVKPSEDVVRSMEFKKDICGIGSRDTIKGKMAGLSFKTSDVSVKTGDIKSRKTQKTVFVGKMIVFDASVKEEGRVLLYLKGCGDATPDAIDDVKKVDIPSLNYEWEAYSSMDSYSKIFTKPVVDALNAFKCDEMMNDVIVSFQKDRTIVALSYSDNLMIIPMENDFKVDGVEHYKQDMEKVISFAKAISKNKSFVK